LNVKFIYILAKKNLLDSLKDPKVILLGFLAPLVLVFLMGTLFNFEIKFDEFSRIGYYVEGDSPFDIEILNPYGFFLFTKIPAPVEAGIDTLFKEKDLVGYIKVTSREDFTKVEFFKNTEKATLANVCSGILRAAVEKENILASYSKTLKTWGIKEEIIADARQAAVSAKLVGFSDAWPMAGASENKYLRYAIGMLGMFLLFTGLFESVFKILEEKKDRVFNRYQLYGIKNREILLGKIISIFLTVALITLLFFFVAYLFLGIDIANKPVFAFICGAYALLIASFSVLLSILLKHSSDVQTILMPLLLVLSLLGGFWIPLENLSVSLQRMSIFLPTGAFMTAGLAAARSMGSDPHFFVALSVLLSYSVLFIAISLKKINFIKKGVCEKI